MAVAKNSKVSTAKKGTKSVAVAAAATVPEAKIVESPARISRRSAPAKTAAASPSPSPSRVKTLKKKSASTSKKAKKVESEEENAPVAKSVPISKSKSAPSTASKSKSSGSCAKSVIRGYLILYNTLSALAWSFLLFNLAKSFFLENLHNPHVLFQKTGLYLACLQTVALLEVMHAALGWVRSGVISNVIQIASRLFVIWVAGVYGGSGKHWAYGMMAVAWALSDFTRYAYYLTQLTDASAPLLKWARYNFFLILYPVGTLGEAILIYLARLKWAKNLALSYGLLTVLAIYTPGFLYMYAHMLQQRAKHFSIESTSSQSEETSVPSKQRKHKAK